MPAPSKGLSKRQVNRAGDLLRDWWMNPNAPRLGALDPTDPLTDAMILLLFEHRPRFQAPLDKVVMGLRSMVKSTSPGFGGRGAKLPVAQRLKRETQIIDKLARHPRMKLARMQDIGGCRAVLPGGAPEVQKVLDRIERARWDIRGDVDDYVTHPTRHEYRAVHVVVMRDECLIEIQLRTPGQQQWAVAVERASNRLRMPLKFGVGDPDLLKYFERAAHGIALQEAGQTADDSFTTEFTELRSRVAHHFQRTST
jgi:putative GTP pyrophosphokinase